jgi:hypothetical protein
MAGLAHFIPADPMYLPPSWRKLGRRRARVQSRLLTTHSGPEPRRSSPGSRVPPGYHGQRRHEMPAAPMRAVRPLARALRAGAHPPQLHQRLLRCAERRQRALRLLRVLRAGVHLLGAVVGRRVQVPQGSCLCALASSLCLRPSPAQRLRDYDAVEAPAAHPHVCPRVHVGRKPGGTWTRPRWRRCSVRQSAARPRTSKCSR